MAVYPANDSALVNQLGEILGADLDVIMSLNNLDEESNKKHPFPCPTSYRTALTYYLDITNPPRTNVLYELAQYASEPSEQEQLRKMASSSGEGKELYLSWVVEARRHILAILQDYPSLRPPIDHLCELLPRLQARYYSIASSSKVRWARGSGHSGLDGQLLSSLSPEHQAAELLGRGPSGLGHGVWAQRVGGYRPSTGLRCLGYTSAW